RRRHTRSYGDWSSDVCSSDLITPRRWLLQANPQLAALITECIENDWARDLGELRLLEPLADNAGFRTRFAEIKRENKVQLGRIKIGRASCRERGETWSSAAA